MFVKPSLRDFTPVEIFNKSTDHLDVVVDLALGLLLLLHLGGHHGLHGGGLGGEDVAMAGEPLTLLTDNGPVREHSAVLQTHLLNRANEISSTSR